MSSVDGRTESLRFLIGSVYVFMALQAVQAVVSFIQVARGGGGDGFGNPIDAADLTTAILGFLAQVVSGVLILRWIYRVNKRARQISPGALKVSPGWNVGWFFVPIANLWKPFQGVRETYQASVQPHSPEAALVPPLLHRWWGAWIVYNIADNIGFRLQGNAHLQGAEALSQVFYGIASVVALPLGLLLIAVVRLITDAQRRAVDESVFS